MMFTNSTRRPNYAKDPAVVSFHGSYYLYHTIPETDGPKNSRWGIGIAKSSDLENWTVIGELPPTQPCEEKGICAPGAIVRNDTVHLFYQSYRYGKDDAICHAYSKDGVHFEKDASNPVYSPTRDWCCGRAIDADVCAFGQKLFLYLATRDHAFQIQKLGAAYADLNSDFSASEWKQACSHAILTPEMEWEQACIEAPAAISRYGKIFLFYGGAYNCSPQQIGCAVSEDGIHFERIRNTPVLPNGGKDDWNSSESGHPYVFEDSDGRTYLFYQGSNDGGKTWYISKAGIEWEAELPVIVP